MGKLFVESKYVDKIPKIEIKLDESLSDSDKSVKGVTQNWGNILPVVQINDEVLDSMSVVDLSITIRYNELPKFSITVRDPDFKIRRALKKEAIDLVNIFIGGKNWYIKSYGVVFNSPSDAGNNEIYLYGSFWNDKLYGYKQESFKDKTILDIYKQICNDTDMGLFGVEDEFTTKTHKYIINSNNKHIEFFDYVVKKFSSHIWSVDTNGIFYFGDVNKLREQPVDTFKIFEDKEVPEKPIKLSNNKSEEKNNEIFGISSYTIKSSIGLKNLIKTKKKYNTFPDFETHCNIPYPYETLDFMDRLLEVELDNNIYEITPFSVVDVEISHFRTEKETNKPQSIDSELSGKKLVVGIEYIYNVKPNNVSDMNSKIRQRLLLL